ncbi:M48 family metallopeptidase [Anaerosacchariphilus polymeriproducens]|uniref:M48 family peptidase n=1 Tax=Anaerosacchariphilus polymeriproducens TaxID=1812858 RepID=A0A371AV24_9FIRM|nr:SprT family zinc-dependent metalloprotease [Anaerosacchariphilus polymeriproducens]RDU23425.1 M48 family peptidase [Anaerosacchariphilus polymeriproducens]
MKKIIVEGIPLFIEKKRIKNLYLKVKAPDGQVQISAPYLMPESEIKKFVQIKLSWIEEKQKEFQKLELPIEHQYISGETIYLWGRDYELEVISYHRNHVKIEGDKLILRVKDSSTLKQREKVLLKWYREQMKFYIPIFIRKWENTMKVKVDDWGVKNMKTRWGTCNIRDRRIWLNLQLAKRPIQCLEYVVVHEMVHLLERKHNDKFVAYMDKFLPEWKEYKRNLENRKYY